MRSKSQDLKNSIIIMVNEFYDGHRRVPYLREIGENLNINKSTVMRYLKEMNDEGTLEYDGQKIITAHIDRLLNQHIAKLPLVGSIPCGDPETEEQQNGEYIEVPISFVGSGSYYVLIADGDSMINAGINDGDMVIVRRTATANYGQIIVALDENNRNTLKRYEYDKKQKRPYLHPENDKYDDIYSEKISIQGVAEKVIKDLM